MHADLKQLEFWHSCDCFSDAASLLLDLNSETSFDMGSRIEKGCAPQRMMALFNL